MRAGMRGKGKERKIYVRHECIYIYGSDWDRMGQGRMKQMGISGRRDEWDLGV